jgi:phycocyanobilin lyase subunit alpha
MPDASSVDFPTAEGEPLSVEGAIANLQGSDLGLRIYAAWWLGRFRAGGSEAVDLLILALDDEADRTEAGGYPLRRNAARALGKLGDQRAVPVLIQSLDCSDFYVREAAAQALKKLGDQACIPHLLRLLQSGLQENQLIPPGPELSQPFDALLEALGGLGALAAIPFIYPFLDHPIQRIQCSANAALYQLTQDPAYGDRLVSYLASPQLQLRRSVLGDLGRIGYIPAATEIAQALAENSLKLISLQGLLEAEIDLETQWSNPLSVRLSESSIQIMTLMDHLL